MTARRIQSDVGDALLASRVRVGLCAICLLVKARARSSGPQDTGEPDIRRPARDVSPILAALSASLFGTPATLRVSAALPTLLATALIVLLLLLTCAALVLIGHHFSPFGRISRNSMSKRDTSPTIHMCTSTVGIMPAGRGSGCRALARTMAIDGAGHVLLLTVHQWFNEPLMAVFFLLAGLEITRDVSSANWPLRAQFLVLRQAADLA